MRYGRIAIVIPDRLMKYTDDREAWTTQENCVQEQTAMRTIAQNIL